MSDEDDDAEDMETGEINRGQRGARRSLGESNPITADQLASAIAAAQSTLGIQSAAASSGGMGGMTGFTSTRQPSSSSSVSRPTLRSLSIPSGSGGGSNPTGSRSASSGITQDQLAAALAFAGVAGFGQAQGGLISTMGGLPPVGVAPQQPPNYESQLATMRELGISNTGLATRALQIMDGDVQAAIDLIYSGWTGNDDSAN